MGKLKVGILTYNSEMNYGCTLQAFAMQEAYRELGCDPVLIDRYITRDNRLLLGPLVQKSPMGCLRNLYHCLFSIGRAGVIRRALKSMRFHRRYLNKTTYSFFDWEDAPRDLGFDLISVGSDQVWNANLYTPVPYLLKDIAPNVPAISYAASIGMPRLMETYIDEYRAGFARFRAISVREQQAVNLVEGFGFKADRVLDPTLLVSPSLWDRFKSRKVHKRRRLLCYTLAEQLFDLLPMLEDFATRNDCDVIIFPDRFEQKFSMSIGGMRDLLSHRLRLLKSPVKVFLSADYEDFMREISATDWIVTNSYHALMFSIIYERNVRIIVPTDEVRKEMHARMQEFEGTIVRGPLMQPGIEEALSSFERQETITIDHDALNNQRDHSRQWLTRQLQGIVSELNP